MSDSDQGNGRGTRLPQLDRPGIDGEDPMAEVGPNQAEPGPADCEAEPGERAGKAHESEWKVSDEIDEAFPIEALATPMAADGLPDHSVNASAIPEAHPFTYDNQCCVGDARSYVELFDGEVATAPGQEPLPRQQGWTRDMDPKSGATTHRRFPLAYPIKLVTREPYDKKTGEPTERASFDPAAVTERWGQLVVPTRDGFIPVRPVREACMHYKRQHFANDDNPIPGEQGHNVFFINCTHPHRRSIGGAAMGLRNEAIYGCEYRHPYDAESVRHVQDYYQNTLDKRPHLTRLPLFGMAGDVVVQKDQPS
jgi:hypothetical protein